MKIGLLVRYRLKEPGVGRLSWSLALLFGLFMFIIWVVIFVSLLISTAFNSVVSALFVFILLIPIVVLFLWLFTDAPINLGSPPG